MTFDTRNSNALWAGLLVEELVRCGVTRFFLAPGSRSTPLVAAVAAHPRAEAVVHVDERGTAFGALGCARATGRPAAWITTSGTAVANGFPAVVEASVDGVPLLLLTADRPPELRHTGANQTIDQVKLFGDYVRWQFDVPPPDPAMRPEMVLTTVDQAVYRTLRAPRGPVHLNCMFREPLAPDDDGRDYAAYLAPLHAWAGSAAPFTVYAPPPARPDAAATEALWDELRGVERGLVVAGRLDTAAEGAAVRHLAAALGWPLLPDVASQARLGPADDAVPLVPFYDVLLASEAFRAAHPPEAVLHVGRASTSKRLLQFVERTRPGRYAVVRPDPFRFDPNHQATHRLEADPVAFCAALAAHAHAAPGRAGAAWRAAWKDASAKAGAALDDFFGRTHELSEPMVARLVARELPEGHRLVLASSMPVRDVDAFAAPGGAAAHVTTNRGASGIDGTVATAAGVSIGAGSPATLVVGDLALLHDLNSLALLRGRPVVVVAVNNDGGGIFSFLPIARHADVFEPYFGTPHGLTFEHAAALFGLDYDRPETPAAFADAYRAACRRPGPTLIEVRTERIANRALHADLPARVAAALS